MSNEQPDQKEGRSVTFLEPPKKQKWWANLRSNFLTGFVVFAPISITIYLVWTFAAFVDARVLPLVPIVYKLEDEKVCMIQYPRKGIWALAFISTDTSGEVLSRSGEVQMMSVFLPTTPNPTSGFLLFLPAQDVVILDMTVEDAAKLVISAGLVTPPWGAEEVAEAARVKAAADAPTA